MRKCLKIQGSILLLAFCSQAVADSEKKALEAQLQAVEAEKAVLSSEKEQKNQEFQAAPNLLAEAIEEEKSLTAMKDKKNAEQIRLLAENRSLDHKLAAFPTNEPSTIHNLIVDVPTLATELVLEELALKGLQREIQALETQKDSLEADIKDKSNSQEQYERFIVEGNTTQQNLIKNIEEENLYITAKETTLGVVNSELEADRTTEQTLEIDIGTRKNELTDAERAYDNLQGIDFLSTLKPAFEEHMAQITPVVKLTQEEYLHQVENLKQRVGYIKSRIGTCTAFLISPTVIRTAGHCYDEEDRQRWLKEKFPEFFAGPPIRPADIDSGALRLDNPHRFGGLPFPSSPYAYAPLPPAVGGIGYDFDKNASHSFYALESNYPSLGSFGYKNKMKSEEQLITLNDRMNYVKQTFRVKFYGSDNTVGISAINKGNSDNEIIEFTLSDPQNITPVTITAPDAYLPLGIVQYSPTSGNVEFTYDCGEFSLDNNNGIIRHHCSTEKGSSGAILIQDEKVIGMHIGATKASKLALDLTSERPNLYEELKKLSLEYDCDSKCGTKQTFLCPTKQQLFRKCTKIITDPVCETGKQLDCAARSAKATLRIGVHGLKNSIANLKDEIAKIDRNLTQLKQAISARNISLINLKDEIGRLGAGVEELGRQVSEKSKKISLNNIKSKITEAKNEISIITVTLPQKKLSILPLQEQVKSITNKLNEAKAEAGRLQENVARSEKYLSIAHEKKKQLNDELKVKTKIKVDLQRAIKVKTTTLQQVKENLQDTKTKIVHETKRLEANTTNLESFVLNKFNDLGSTLPDISHRDLANALENSRLGVIEVLSNVSRELNAGNLANLDSKVINTSVVDFLRKSEADLKRQIKGGYLQSQTNISAGYDRLKENVSDAEKATKSWKRYGIKSLDIRTAKALDKALQDSWHFLEKGFENSLRVSLKGFDDTLRLIGLTIVPKTRFVPVETGLYQGIKGVECITHAEDLLRDYDALSEGLELISLPQKHGASDLTLTALIGIKKDLEDMSDLLALGITELDFNECESFGVVEPVRKALSINLKWQAITTDLITIELKNDL